FKDTFSEIGNIIKKHNMKITMHPDQFVVLNSPKEAVVAKSIRELDYHVKVLDYLGLDSKAKLVLHVGGVYDDKKEAMKRFITNYKQLSQKIKDHLIIEHDDKLYSVKDCLYIHEQTGVPIVFDNFHHECLNNGEEEKKALEAVLKTWNPQKDGVPVTHYSSQNLNGPKGKHCDSIDIEHFKKYIENTKDLEFDIMLEIRDKEQSALETLSILHTIRKEMSVS
ncbi:MAG: UV DNA damage repair endonuclease UvsE, partial [Candidatus Woesearchaeota archaeon]